MLNFIGTGSAFNTKLGNTSAYIEDVEDNEALFLIDCGSTTFNTMPDYLKNKKRCIIAITHTHADHVGSLATLILYRFYKLDLPTTILAHSYQEDEIKSLLFAMGVNHDLHTIQSHNNPINISTLKSTEPVRTKHGGMINYSLILNHESYKEYYSGDVEEIPPHILEQFIKREIKYLYLDATTSTKNITHLNITTIIEKIPPHLREYVTLMHLDDEPYSYSVMEALNLNIAKPQY